MGLNTISLIFSRLGSSHNRTRRSLSTYGAPRHSQRWSVWDANLGSSAWRPWRSQRLATAARGPPGCSPWRPSPAPASSSARSEWQELSGRSTNTQSVTFFPCGAESAFTCLLCKCLWESEQLYRSSWHCFWSLDRRQTPAWCERDFPPLLLHPWNTRGATESHSLSALVKHNWCLCTYYYIFLFWGKYSILKSNASHKVLLPGL